MIHKSKSSKNSVVGKSTPTSSGKASKRKRKEATDKKVLSTVARLGKKEKQGTLLYQGRSNEIEDLFKGLTSKSQSIVKEQGQCKSKREESVQPLCGSKDDIFGNEAAAERKRTEEGFAIYTEEELGFGKKGGTTDLCPFDCQCCF